MAKTGGHMLARNNPLDSTEVHIVSCLLASEYQPRLEKPLFGAQ